MVLHGSVAVRESQEGTFLGSGFVLDGVRRDEENSDPFWIGRCQRAGSPAAGYLTGTSVISVAEAGVTLVREQQSLRRRDGKSVAACAFGVACRICRLWEPLCVQLGSMPSAHLHQNQA